MSIYLVSAVVLFLYMNIWFFLSLILKRNDIADTAWGVGFVVLAWTTFYIRHTDTAYHAYVVLFFVTIWGLRLAWHITKRNIGKPEDARYNKWRKEWGRWFILRSYIQIYILQGVLLYIISIPVLFILNTSSPGSMYIYLFGCLVWCIGFAFESVGDAQLRSFLKNPKNKGTILQTGLWKYSRHPNYFGEVTQWWGIWILACSLPMGWLTIVSPITITFLIAKVSGIPMLEEHMKDKPGFVQYKEKTSKFFPLPPKH